MDRNVGGVVMNVVERDQVMNPWENYRTAKGHIDDLQNSSGTEH